MRKIDFSSEDYCCWHKKTVSGGGFEGSEGLSVFYAIVLCFGGPPRLV